MNEIELYVSFSTAWNGVNNYIYALEKSVVGYKALYLELYIVCQIKKITSNVIGKELSDFSKGLIIEVILKDERLQRLYNELHDIQEVTCPQSY